jgi:CheY-like chemotaxis protein
MDGFAVARQIRQDRGLDHLRIIAITGYPPVSAGFTPAER